MGKAGDDVKDRGRAVRWFSVLLNHDFGSFDHGADGVALLEFEFVGAAAGDCALNQVLSDANHHVSHDIAELNFFDFSTQVVSG